MNKQIADEIFISGYAKLPGDITASNLYKVIAVGLLIETKTGIIKKSECTLATSVSRGFLTELINGTNINDEDKLIHIIEISYFGSAKKSLIAALVNCKKKYDELKLLK